MLPFLALIDDPEERSLCERLYSTYGDEMLRLAMAELDSPSDAEDVVHDVFVYIAKNAIGKLAQRSESRRRRYLLIATRHRSWNLAKKNNIRPRIYEEPVAEYERISNSEFLRLISSADAAQEVEAALSELPPIYRDTLYLRFVDGYGGRDIARTLGISEAAVWKRLERGKKLLAELIERGRRQ